MQTWADFLPINTLHAHPSCMVNAYLLIGSTAVVAKNKYEFLLYTHPKRQSLQPKFKDIEIRYTTIHTVVLSSSKGTSYSVD